MGCEVESPAESSWPAIDEQLTPQLLARWRLLFGFNTSIRVATDLVAVVLELSTRLPNIACTRRLASLKAPRVVRCR
jgi:ketosteroid isomerase-like protein